MSFIHKTWVVLGVLLVVMVGALFLKPPVSEAQTATAACPAGNQLFGWAWSANTGWISFNSNNPTGHGGRHCVSVDTSGYVKGYAWSSNIGWIKFGGLSGFPAGGNAVGNARVIGSQLAGWARACNGTVRSDDVAANPQYIGDCSSSTSRQDGWDGWIELTGTTHSISYNGGTVTGYAWGGEGIGWTYLNLTYADVTSSPTPTTYVEAASCTLTKRDNGDIGNGKHNYTLTWVGNSKITQCRGVSSPTDSRWTGVVSGQRGSISFDSPVVDTNYDVKCANTDNATEITCSSRQQITGVADKIVVKLTVADSRYGTKTNQSDWSTGIPLAKVRKGVPFTLTGEMDTSLFDSYSVNDDDTSTVTDPTKVNASQQVTQNTQFVTYVIGGQTPDGVQIQTSIKVQAVDSSLDEI